MLNAEVIPNFEVTSAFSIQNSDAGRLFDMTCSRLFARLSMAIAIGIASVTAGAQDGAPNFKVLASSPGINDQAHISFVREANRWFPDLALTHGFSYEATTDWSRLHA